MDVIVEKSCIAGLAVPPASKSAAHRLLIAAFLSGEGCFVSGRLQGGDIAATADMLSRMGADIVKREDGIGVLAQTSGMLPHKCGKASTDDALVNETAEHKAIYYKAKTTNSADRESADGKIAIDAKPIVLNARESGSSLRFLLPVAAALGIFARFEGEGRLPQRPLGELTAQMESHGVSFSSKKLPFEISGQLEGGTYEIDGGISSQYITGLLFALPLLEADSRIILKSAAVSQSYIDITLEVLEKFGIEIRKEDGGYFVRGKQKYHCNRPVIAAEGDWSSACFWAVAAALCAPDGVKLSGLNPSSAQGDRIIVSLLERAGANIKFQNGMLEISKSELHAIDFDCTDCPDIVPIMAVALAFAQGESHISGVDRLRAKESDRLAAVTEALNVMKIHSNYRDGVLHIQGAAFNGESEAFNGESEAFSVDRKAIGSNQTNGAKHEIDGKPNAKVNIPAHFETSGNAYSEANYDCLKTNCTDCIENSGTASNDENRIAASEREFETFNDHRMAMSAVVAALALSGKSRVRDIECTNKSYPSFIEDMKKAGAKIKELQ
jgi:3-phosphoshikimate 1-carboxyvinyltransferase